MAEQDGISDINVPLDVALFQKKVDKTVLLDDIAPAVTLSTIRTAVGQFGRVVSVKILESPLNPKLSAKRALVEMASQQDAVHVIKEIQDRPFIMMKGIPRPVIARAAEATMYPERPSKRRRMLPGGGSGKSENTETRPSFGWVSPGDPDWDVVTKEKQLVKKHLMEYQYLTQELRKEEWKLATEQEERAAAFLDKFSLVESCVKDKIIGQLGRYYGLRVNGP